MEIKVGSVFLLKNGKSIATLPPIIDAKNAQKWIRQAISYYAQKVKPIEYMKLL